MRGEPLTICRRHPEDGPIWHRASKPCPVCRAEERVQQLQQQLREATTRVASRTSSERRDGR